MYCKEKQAQEVCLRYEVRAFAQVTLPGPHSTADQYLTEYNITILKVAAETPHMFELSICMVRSAVMRSCVRDCLNPSPRKNALFDRRQNMNTARRL